MKGKKGIEEQVVGIIIAAICLLLLIGIAVTVYKNVKNNEYDSVKKLSKNLETKINLFKSGEKATFVLQSPCINAKECEWRLFAWGKDEATRPDRCYFKSCLCFCKVPRNSLGYPKEISELCQNSQTGVCTFYSFSEFSIIKQDVFNGNDRISNFIDFEKSLIRIYFSQDEKGVSLLYNSSTKSQGYESGALY